MSLLVVLGRTALPARDAPSVAADLAALMASLVRVDFAVGELVLLRALVWLVVFTAAAVLCMDVST